MTRRHACETDKVQFPGPGDELSASVDIGGRFLMRAHGAPRTTHQGDGFPCGSGCRELCDEAPKPRHTPEDGVSAKHAMFRACSSHAAPAIASSSGFGKTAAACDPVQTPLMISVTKGAETALRRLAGIHR